MRFREIHDTGTVGRADKDLLLVRNHVALTLDFRRGGNADAYQLDGWWGPETAFCWTNGNVSSLRLPRLTAPFGWALEIRCAPFTVSGVLESQRLVVRVDGREVASENVRYACSLAWRLPDPEPGLGDVIVSLELPDCVRPCEISASRETRRVALMVLSARLLVLDEAPEMPSIRSSAIRFGDESTDDDVLAAQVSLVSGMPIDEFAILFEGLIGNCEFGFFQRRCGGEPLSLLRFAAGRVALVLNGLDRGFEGIGNPAALRANLTPGGEEWMIEDTNYGLVYHTFTSPTAVSQEEMYPREGVRLRFLARKLLEDVTDGHKIFVCKDEFNMSQAELLPVLLSLHRRGPCTMMWVSPCDNSHTPGSVEVVAPNLFRAFIDRFAPPANLGQFSFAGWLNICVNAWLLHRRRPLVAATAPG